MPSRCVWAAVAVAIACGPTEKSSTQFAPRGIPLQSFPFTTTLSGATFGRDLTASQEVSNMAALFPATPAGNGGGWYHRYDPQQPNDNLVSATGYEFVPSFYWHADVTSPNLASAAAASSRWIIGFNEPDLSTGGNMTVAQACADWPSLEATGKKLVSPSCSCDESSGTGGNWFHDFVNGVGCGGYTPHFDAISVHHYTANFGDATGGDLFTYLTNIHNRYPDKELWLTEFGMWGFVGGFNTNTFPSSAQAQAYITTVIPKLRNLGYVTRWEWYPDVGSASAISVNSGYANVVLANPDGTVTTLGTLYSQL